jgi:hypothetical protein
LGGVYTRPARNGCYVGRRDPGFGACFADGSTRFIRSSTDEQTAQAVAASAQAALKKIEP